jgi:ABC-2 type transport system permease protein
MTTLAYTRFELLRTLRSIRFFVFSLGFPLGFYFVMAGPNRDVRNLGGSGIAAPLYYMTGMAMFGTIAAMLSSGARIAAERMAGWTRQLRLTPLPARAYLRSKVTIGYLMALLTLALLYGAGSVLGVRLPAATWLHMTSLLLVGLIPFAALGIVLGHVLTVDAIGPAVGGLTSILAFLAGAWFPLRPGLLADIAQYLPSYWLIQASRVAAGGQTWPAQGWLVIAVWTGALAALARYAYRRDTQRI